MPNALLLAAKNIEGSSWTTIRIPHLNFLKIDFKIICFLYHSVIEMDNARFHSYRKKKCTKKFINHVINIDGSYLYENVIVKPLVINQNESNRDTEIIME